MVKIPLVLVTGLLSNSSVFQYQKEKLKDVANVWIVELNDTATPTAMVEKILHLAPPRFALAGHSIGGFVALKLMKTASEKVIKLCLLNTSARGIDQEEKEARLSVLKRVNQGEFTKIINETTNKFVFNDRIKSDVLKMFDSVGKQALINQTEAMLAREDLQEVLPEIHCPTLIIHAANDKRFSLEHLEELVDHIPSSKLAIIEDCGHMSPMESPQTVTSLLRYWLTYF